MKSAEIIAVGSELLGRKRLDTNSLYLTGILEKYGISVKFKSIVGDDFERLSSVVKNAISRCDILLITGGLGPTDDDITREAVANAVSKKLKLNEKQLEILKKRYENAHVEFRENSKKQAFFIEGSEIVPNGPGSAPGQFLEFQNTLIFLFPGVPREMKFMAENFLIPKLEKYANNEKKHEIILNFAGIPESLVDSKLSHLKFEEKSVTYTILASLMRVQIIISGKDISTLKKFKNEILLILGNAFFGEGDIFLPEHILDKLSKKSKTLSVAESCTGGFLGKSLTDVPGSSIGFLGGIICYSNDLKINLLDVPVELIEEKGAVSGNVAVYLSNNIRFLTKSNYGIGITGVAGPGQSEKKPAGLVYISVSSKYKTIVKKYNFSGTREMVRVRAVTAALNLLRLEFLSD